jgi:hypothetical protein
MSRTFISSDKITKLDRTDPNTLPDELRELLQESSGSYQGLGTFLAVLDGNRPTFLAEQTGDGTEQSVAHNGGRAPSKVVPLVTEIPSDGYGSAVPFDFVEGSHTATYAKWTMTSGVKFVPMVIFDPGL